MNSNSRVYVHVICRNIIMALSPEELLLNGPHDEIAHCGEEEAEFEADVTC